MTVLRPSPAGAKLPMNSLGMVQAAEGCLTGNIPAADCAQTLFDAFKPEAYDLATALAAVYTVVAPIGPADMVAILTPLYGAETAQAVGTKVYGIWHDLMIRDTLSDVGVVPYPGTDISQSPDIYPVGQQQLSDPSVLLTNWMSGPTSNIYWNSGGTLSNYIYVRVTNLFPAATPWYVDPSTGHLEPDQVFLYYARASLLLMPSQWSQNQIPTAPDQIIPEPATVSASAYGEHAVALPPFVWQPTPPPAGDHYCLIARTSTFNHPNPIPADGSLVNFTDWVRDNPDISWRNVSLVYTGSSRARQATEAVRARSAELAASAFAYTCDVVFPNPEPEILTFALQVVATDMPVGTTIQLSCADNPGFNLGPVAVQGPTQQWVVKGTLPPQFMTQIQETVVLPEGATLAPTSKVSLVNYTLAEQGVELYSRGRNPQDFGIAHTDVGLSATGAVVWLGNYDLMFAEGPDPAEPADAEF